MSERTSIVPVGKVPALGDVPEKMHAFVIRPEITNSVPGDLGGYAPLNVARIQGIHSGPLYHTSGDVLESISTPGLEKAARFYAYLIEHAMTMPKGDINP